MIRTATTEQRTLKLFAAMEAQLRAEICGRIGQARERRGFTQAEFAELLHVVTRTVQNYEADRVPWDRLDEIAELTGVTRQWLIDGDRPADNGEMAAIQSDMAAINAKLTELLRRLPDDRPESGEQHG